MAANVPYPSDETLNLKKWLICEWYTNPDIEAMLESYPSFDTLAETRAYVNTELNRFYDEIGEDLIPGADYVTGPATSTAPNIIYDLPDEDGSNHVILCKGTNGPTVFGLSVWRNGYNPDFADE